MDSDGFETCGDSTTKKSFVFNIIFGGTGSSSTERTESCSNENHDELVLLHSNNGDDNSFFGNFITMIFQKTTSPTPSLALMQSFWNLDFVKRGLCLVDGWFPFLAKYISPGQQHEKDETVGANEHA